MGSRKIEQRGIAERAKHESEICEIGEDRIKEAEGTLTWGGIEAIDDECSCAVSSRFAPPNEDISRMIAALEQLDDDSNDIAEEARRQSVVICGLGGMSEKEIMEPSGETGESLLPVIDEIAELPVVELAKLFDF